MALQFNHKPQGSLIGSGGLQFRHYGDEEITDLTGTTWLLNLDAEINGDTSTTYDITYITNAKTFTQFYAPFRSLGTKVNGYDGYYYNYTSIIAATIYYYIYGRTNSGSNSYGCSEGVQAMPPVIPTENSAYQTISITGGSDTTNTTLIDWLQANAVKQ